MTWQPRKPDKASVQGPKPPHADPGQFGSDYPALAWYMSASQWPDESPKPAGRLETSIYLGKWQATLKLPGTGLMLRLEIPGPEYVHEALDAALRLETVPWMVDPWSGTGDTKKGPKKGA